MKKGSEMESKQDHDKKESSSATFNLSDGAFTNWDDITKAAAIMDDASVSTDLLKPVFYLK